MAKMPPHENPALEEARRVNAHMKRLQGRAKLLDMLNVKGVDFAQPSLMPVRHRSRPGGATGCNET